MNEVCLIWNKLLHIRLLSTYGDKKHLRKKKIEGLTFWIKLLVRTYESKYLTLKYSTWVIWTCGWITAFLLSTFFFFSSKQYFYSYKKAKSYCRWFSKNSARSDFWFWSYLPYFQSWSWFKFVSCCFVLLPSTTNESSSVLIIQSFPNWFTVKVDTKPKSLPTLFLWQSLKSQEMILLIKDLHE